MVPRGGRKRLAALGLGTILAAVSVAPLAATPANQARGQKVSTLYCKHRSFKIPFNVDEADKKRLREVQLFVSDNYGDNWEMKSRANIDQPTSFRFQASHDGEHWFAVRTIDLNGHALPDQGEVEPNLKVIVDTVAPSLVLEQEDRRGSTAKVRWEVRDENLDLNSLVLEYQQEGARSWRQVPIHRLKLMGMESWDAGTAGPIKVRATVEDKAHNKAETIITLDDGAAAGPAALSSDLPSLSSPPGMSPITAGPNFPPIDDTLKPNPPQDFPVNELTKGARSQKNPEPDPESYQSGLGQATPEPRPSDPRPPANAGPRTLLVATPKFSLQYAVEDAGPNGPANVELWVTQDGGRTWNRHSEDSDRVSPIDVDLGGEGTFGLCLVARALSGLGDQPPVSGDPPQIWVQVDGTPPSVKLGPPQIGTGTNVGKVLITWNAADIHLVPRPITLSWRADQPNSPWQPIVSALDNSGRYIWTVPPNTPPKIHIRVEAADSVGNRGSADTADIGPVIVDRTRPRGRIIGLDGGPQAGEASGFRPVRQ